MEKTPIQDASKKKKNNKFLHVLPWIGTALFIVTIAAGAYFYTTKQPIALLAPSGTSVTVIVCGSEVVNTYNAASRVEVRGSDDDLTLDVAGLSRLDTEIRSKSGFEQDPTCQTILFWNAVIDGDTGRAGVALKAIESLHAEQHFANSNLENTTSISVMKESLAAAIEGAKR